MRGLGLYLLISEKHVQCSGFRIRVARSIISFGKFDFQFRIVKMCKKRNAEFFFRKVKFWKEDGEEEAPPIFNVDGLNYFHVKENIRETYPFVIMTSNDTYSRALELLESNDYFGMKPTQVHLLKQEKVVFFDDNDG